MGSNYTRAVGCRAVGDISPGSARNPQLFFHLPVTVDIPPRQNGRS